MDSDYKGGVGASQFVGGGESWATRGMIAVVRPEPPRPVADLIATAMPQLTERLVEHQIRRAWSGIVGRDVARRTEPRSLANGILDVGVDNSPWLHELTLRAAELTDRVRQRFADVRLLRFVPGAVDTAPSPIPARQPRPAALSAAELREIDEAAACIPDPTLAAAARRLLTTARRFPTPSGGVR